MVPLSTAIFTAFCAEKPCRCSKKQFRGFGRGNAGYAPRGPKGLPVGGTPRGLEKLVKCEAAK
jgi:hypothetical protein